MVCPLYPPKADIAEHGRHVRFVPEAEVAAIRSVELIVQPDAKDAIDEMRVCGDWPPSHTIDEYKRDSSSDGDTRSCGVERARIQCDTGKLLDERESRPPSGDGLTHFEVKTVSASRPPSEPFSIVLLKRTSAAVAMASFI